MAEYRNSCQGKDREMVCIDTYRVLDSCRDKDCFEDVRVFLTPCGQEIVDRTSAVRAKCANVVYSCINIDSVPFNKGFYQLYIKIYVKITFEACLAPGNMETFDGVAVVEKKVILFGSEGSVNIFKSTYGGGGFCSECSPSTKSSSLPRAVFECVDPIILDTKVVEPRIPCRPICPCTLDELPDCVVRQVQSCLCDGDGSNLLLVSLGFFSVVRLERPAQYLVSAVEYSVPEKECVTPTLDDPCCLFKKMAFPVAEFSPPSIGVNGCDNDKKCSCQ